MSSEEVREGLVSIHGANIQIEPVLRQTKRQPNHYHCRIKDFPEDFQEELVSKYRFGRSADSLESAIYQWLNRQKIKGVPYVNPSYSPLQEIPVLITPNSQWPVEKMLPFPMKDFKFKDPCDFVVINTTEVEEGICRVELPISTANRLHRLNSNTRVMPGDQRLLKAMLAARV